MRIITTNGFKLRYKMTELEKTKIIFNKIYILLILDKVFNIQFIKVTLRKYL